MRNSLRFSCDSFWRLILYIHANKYGALSLSVQRNKILCTLLSATHFLAFILPFVLHVYDIIPMLIIVCKECYRCSILPDVLTACCVCMYTVYVTVVDAMKDMALTQCPWDRRDLILFIFIMKSYTRYTIKIKGKSKILSIQRPDNIYQNSLRQTAYSLSAGFSDRWAVFHACHSLSHSFFHSALLQNVLFLLFIFWSV